MRSKFIADLHNHSIYSDGELTPEELIRIYSDANYEGLAITDHDTLEGSRRAFETVEENPNMNIKIIPGVELSLGYDNSYFKGTLHLLLYFSDSLFSNQDVIKKFNFVFSHCRGKALITRRIKALNNYIDTPFKLKIDDFTQFAGQITRRAFYTVLVQKGIPQSEARKLLSNDSPAYIPSGIEPKIAFDVLKNLPLIKVLAHPAAGSAVTGSHYRETSPPFEIVKELAPAIHEAFGLDGLELFYPAHTNSLRNEIIEFANSLKIKIFTGGSDCHDRNDRPPLADGMNEKYWERFFDLWKKLKILNF